jgi:hypothetical protein
MPAVARRRSGEKIQMPSGSAITIANRRATTRGKSRNPIRLAPPKITAVKTATSNSRASAYATTSTSRRDPGRSSVTARAYRRRVYSDQGGFCGLSSPRFRLGRLDLCGVATHPHCCQQAYDADDRPRRRPRLSASARARGQPPTQVEDRPRTGRQVAARQESRRPPPLRVRSARRAFPCAGSPG